MVKYGEAKNAFEIRDIEIPSPGDDDVLIKVTSMGLNFADVVARRGLYPDAPKNPAVLGYDVAGIVEAVGSKVTHLNIGDRVTALTRFGGYAEYVKTSAFGVAKIPDQLSFEEATTLATQACTAYYCLCESINLNPNELVLIHAAAGGVGSIMTQIAKHKNCQVIGTGSTTKQDFMKANGVDFCIDYTKEKFDEAIISKYGKRPVDVIFDSIGGKTFKKGFKILKAGGKIISYGVAAQMNGSKSGKLKTISVALGFGFFSPLQMLMHSQAIIGVNMLRVADKKPLLFQKVLNEVVSFAEQKIIKPRVDKVFTVDAFANAHEYLESRKSIGKVVVNW